MKHLEIQYGQNTLLAGDVSLTNESFDHAFGVEKRVGYEVTDFRVFEYKAKPVSVWRRFLNWLKSFFVKAKDKKDWVETTAFYRRFDLAQLEFLKGVFLLKAQAKLEMESA